EMYIPYNSNKVFTAASPEALLGDHHLNPDVLRWELHRVWVVEATLKSGKRHVMPRSTPTRIRCSRRTPWLAKACADMNGKRWLALCLVAVVPPLLAAPPVDVLSRPATQSVQALHGVMQAITRAGDRLVAVGERGTVLLS
nr:hypothetical protein [Tanacetum cinerariifolium]